MVDNKKQRKSARNFNMEKHVERHFSFMIISLHFPFLCIFLMILFE